MDNSVIQRKFDISIAFKYAVSICLLILLGMGLIAYVIMRNQSGVSDLIQKRYGGIISQQIADSAVEPFFTDDNFELNVLLKNVSSSDKLSGVMILDLDKNIVARAGFFPDRDLDNFYEGSGDDINSGAFGSLYDNIVVHTSPIKYKNVVGGYAVIAFNNESVNDLRKESFNTILFITIFLCACVSMLGIAMGHRFSAPINSLAKAADDLKQGNFKRIPDRRNDEIGLLIDAINDMGNGLIKKNNVEILLNKLVDKDVAKKILEEVDEVELGGERVQATVLFADIVGFTNISENMDPKDVSELLNEYFNYFNQCAKFYYGTVDKFIGDCVMLVFGVPKHDGEHRYHAVACAILMKMVVQRLNEERRQRGLFEVNLRIGINSGEMLAGLIGGQDHMEYTVVGDSVNLASRLCGEAEASQIIIEESFFEEVNKGHVLSVQTKKQIKIRGKKNPVSIYNVIDIDDPHAMVVDDLIEDIIHQRGSLCD